MTYCFRWAVLALIPKISLLQRYVSNRCKASIDRPDVSSSSTPSPPADPSSSRQPEQILRPLPLGGKPAPAVGQAYDFGKRIGNKSRASAFVHKRIVFPLIRGTWHVEGKHRDSHRGLSRRFPSRRFSRIKIGWNIRRYCPILRWRCLRCLGGDGGWLSARPKNSRPLSVSTALT